MCESLCQTSEVDFVKKIFSSLKKRAHCCGGQKTTKYHSQYQWIGNRLFEAAKPVLNLFTISSIYDPEYFLSNWNMSRRNECKIYVGNLPPDVRTKDVEELFDKYGRIHSVELKDRGDPPFAFIEFEDER